MNLITRPLSLRTVGTLIHKSYCSPHLAAEGHTTTSSGELFKFPEFLGSTLYSINLDMRMGAYVEMDTTVRMTYFNQKPQHVTEGLIRIM
jgi:hypothetical protein